MLAVKEKKKISKTSVNFVKRSGAVLIFFTRYIPERDCNKFWEQLKVLTVYVLDVSSEAATRGVLCKKVFEKFTGKHLRRSLFFNKIAGLR